MRAALKKRFRIARRAVGGALLPALGPQVLARLSASWRVERLGEEQLDRAREAGGWLMSMWHGRMLVGLPTHRQRDYCVLVSPSDDGELVQRLLVRNGYHVIRGSSNQRSEPALREMVARLRQLGGALVITPDGPRGPQHSMNDGLAWMAKVTGLPIVPCGFVCDRAWHLKSWDRFTIPRFKARVCLVYGEPVRVPSDADAAALNEISREVRARMLRAEERGFEHLGVAPDC